MWNRRAATDGVKALATIDGDLRRAQDPPLKYAGRRVAGGLHLELLIVDPLVDPWVVYGQALFLTVVIAPPA
eukprot:scaffold181424_cov28-Tisochrysis_lutea.AAC.2